MTWRQRYSVEQFLRSSFWFWPFMVILLSVFVVIPVLDWFDAHGYRLAFLWHDLTAERAHAIVSSFSGSMLTFLVFVLSSLIMVVTLASAQLTPRIMAITFADIQGRLMTCMLLFSFLFGTAILGRLEGDAVPILGIKILVISVLASIILFLRYIPHLGMSLRPISMMRHVAEQGQAAVESIYPHPYGKAASEKVGSVPRKLMRKDARVIPYAGTSGVLLAFGATDLAGAAEAAGCTLELEVQVGDFVSRGDPLFLTFPPDRPIDAGILHQMIAIGAERTLEQDPVFAFRIIVDIANRALSPAVNDPTTAVLAIDQLERLLRFVGSRQLDPGMLYDSDGNLRLIIPAPRWEDYVSLAISEIRLYGANSIQIPRRLVAMLEHLIEVLPPARAPALREELSLLGRAVKREFLDAAERDRVTTGDRQGVGGSTSENS
ncbi:MAG: hypothetical protein A3H91_03630 [Gammaproteobacteria bacterium RIFCSPLOWO2_02_FULL_61_13]|nr:MAG: hypothetical protein A3H91_03630 [Gammaproteobacteria bacterium RIFCSPLOWO2_02_FULL_61_13]